MVTLILKKSNTLRSKIYTVTGKVCKSKKLKAEAEPHANPRIAYFG